jgi:hypothetical protein
MKMARVDGNAAREDHDHGPGDPKEEDFKLGRGGGIARFSLNTNESEGPLFAEPVNFSSYCASCSATNIGWGIGWPGPEKLPPSWSGSCSPASRAFTLS